MGIHARLDQLVTQLEQLDRIGEWLELYGDSRQDAFVAGRDVRRCVAFALGREAPPPPYEEEVPPAATVAPSDASGTVSVHHVGQAAATDHRERRERILDAGGFRDC